MSPWYTDRTYPFTIARLLEGFLEIDLFTLSVPGFSWDLIVGGVDQGITPTIHPGDTVSLSMTAINNGITVDDFRITINAIGATTGTPLISEISPEIVSLAVGATSTWSPSIFVMPDENVDASIITEHEEPY